MGNFIVFIATAMTALAIENAVFARALGLNKSTLFLKSSKAGILYGGTMTFMVTITSMLVALCNYRLLDVSFARAVRAPLFLVCTLIVYTLTYYTLKKFAPRLAGLVLPILPVSTFNTALFGAFYISAMGHFTFIQTTGYALGVGIGYTIALLIIYYARKRLSISPVPRSFRGLPILLLYIGLLSLAIYGLIGHGLPA